MSFVFKKCPSCGKTTEVNTECRLIEAFSTSGDLFVEVVGRAFQCLACRAIWQDDKQKRMSKEAAAKKAIADPMEHRGQACGDDFDDELIREDEEE